MIATEITPVVTPQGEFTGVAVSHQSTTPMELIAAAINNGMPIEVLTKLMDLQERWEKNQGRKAFDLAMADAKAEIPIIIKSCTVDFTSQKGRTHYKHEDMAAIARAIDPVLSRHGLSYRYRTETTRDWIRVVCIVAHRDGHFEETALEGPPDISGNKNALQSIESTVTYLQRYTLKAALGLAAGHDDDGKGGAKGEPKTDAAPRSNPFKPQPDVMDVAPQISDSRVVILAKVADAMQLDDITDGQLNGELAIRYKKPTNWRELPEKHLTALIEPSAWAAVVANINTDPLS